MREHVSSKLLIDIEIAAKTYTILPLYPISPPHSFAEGSASPFTSLFSHAWRIRFLVNIAP